MIRSRFISCITFISYFYAITGSYGPYSYALASPLDGVVTGGSATINQSGATTDIVQHSNRAAIDWRGFDVGANEKVQFHQPSGNALILNRVNDVKASTIDGSISANGHVLILNSNGVLFGAGSKVDVNGLLVTTAGISNNNFMNGNLVFDQAGNPEAEIVNNGVITANNAGLVGFVAPRVINNGVISANLGRVQLSSGDTATVDLYGDNLMEVALSDKVTKQLVRNTGTITAHGGKIAMTAAAGRGVIDSLISVEGELKALSVGQKNGEIKIYAPGRNAVDGNVAANKGVKTGDSAVMIKADIDVSGKGAGETGGTVEALADHVTLLNGTKIDASGTNGGGTVLIGGDYQGLGETATALNTFTEGGASINVDAIENGNGGKAIVWGDDSTYFYGDITARGGAQSGDGGFVEVSGKESLTYRGLVDTQAANGMVGMLLLDPANLLIKNGTGDSATDGTATFKGNATVGTIASADALSTVWESELQGIAANTNVSLTASNSITMEDLTDNTLAFAQTGARTVTIAAGTGGFIMNGANDTISVVSGILNISASGGASTISNLSTGGAINITTTSTGTVSVGNITSSGLVTLNLASTGNVTGVISGTGGVTKSGIGALTLTNDNTYSGVTTVSAGTLVLGNASALGTGGLTLGGGTISGDGTARTISNNVVLSANSTIGGASDITLTGTVALANNGTSRTLTISNTANTAISGVISNGSTATASAVTKSGAGTATLSGNNTYGGATTVSGGTLIIGSNTALGTGALTLGGGTIQGDGTARTLANAVTLTTNTTVAGASDITFNGTWTNTNARTLTVNNTGLTTLGGTVNLSNSATSYIMTVAGTGNTTISGAIVNGSTSTAGGLTKTNTGTLTLSGNKTYGGATLLSGAGTTNISGTNATAGALTVSNGTVNYTGTNSAASTIAVSAGSLEIDGTATSTGNTTVSGTGTLIIGSNTALGTGTLTMGGGTIRGDGTARTIANATTLAASSTVAGTSDLTFNGIFTNSATAGDLIVNNTGATTLAGTVNISNNATNKTLIIDGTGTTTISGVIQNGSTSTAGNLIKNGTGTLTLSGNNTYAGDTTVNAGTLKLGASDRIANTSDLIVGASGIFDMNSFSETVATVTSGGAVNMGTGATLTTVGAGVNSHTGTVTGNNATLASTSGAITATNAANNFTGDLSISTTGAVSIHDANSLALGTVSVGTLTARALNGDLTLNGVTTASAASGNSIILTASGNFINNAGSGALVTGGTARWLVYSTNPANDTIGGLANDFRRFSCTYGGSCPALGTGDGFLYTHTPLLTAAAATVNITYGDATPSTTGYTYTLSGYLGADAAADNVTGSLDGTTTYAQFNNVGNYNINYSSGTLASDMGYAFTYANNANAIAVAAKTLTASLTSTAQKIYDATTAATLSAGNYLLSGIVNSDNVVLNNPTSGAYDNKNVGAGKTVSVSGLALSGTKAGNYTLASTSINGNIGTITAKSLTASLTSTASKVYDATTAATLAAGNYLVAGIIGGDTVNLNNPTSGVYNDKTVGTAKNVSVTGLAISGADAANYSLAASSINGNIGTITAKSLTASLTSTASKVYDATTAATLAAGNYLVAGIIGGDTVNLNNPTSGVYNDKTVGTAKNVSVTGLAISGADAANYSLAASSINGNIGTITAKSLTASLTSTASKVYDATTAATLAAGNYLVAGIIGGDTVNLNNPTSGVYNDKTVGTAKNVSVTGLNISGADASNYSLASSSINGAIGIINAKSLTASLTGTVQKIYDATTAAAISAGNYIVSGVIGGDTVNLNNPTSGVYNDKNVGTGKNVAVSGLSVSGADAGNYALTSSSINGSVGQIDVKSITASLTGTVQKVYDATTAAAISAGNYIVSGVIGGDAVNLNNPTSGAYDNKNVGTGKTVSVTGLSISGTDAGNYNLASSSINGAIGTILAKALTASLTGSVAKTYDATTAATLTSGNYNLSGVLGGETVNLNNPTSGTYNDKNAATGKTVSVTGINISGADASNYSLASSSINGAIGIINAKSLTASLTGTVQKVYDATTAATLAAGNYVVSGVIGGDTVNLNNPTSGTYNNKNVGTGKAVSVSSLAISGTDASNYALASTSVNGNIGQIDAKTLLASLTGSTSRVYDGTTDATLTGGNYNLSGVIGGDTVNLNNPTSGTYNNKNIGTGKNVAVTGLSVSGTDAGNYALASSSVNGNIGIVTAKTLTASLTGTVQKIYDATTTAAIAAGNYVLSGIIASENVTLNNPTSGAYNNKNVGTGKTVSVTGLAIGGADVGNYTLASSSINGNVGQVDAKSLTASLTGTAQKIYDGATTATLAGANYNLAGIVGSEDVTLDISTSGTYNNKNVGTGKNVAVSGLSISGTDIGNYTLASSSINGNIGQIDAKTLSASLTGTVQKIYDAATTAALAAGNYNLSGVLGGDTVNLNNPTSGTYNNKNVGTGKNVTVSGLSISGTDAGNYALASSSINGNVGQIDVKTLTASLSGSVSKTYDATTAATIAGGNYNLAGIIGGDTVNLNSPTSGSYNDKNAGTGKTVSVSGLAISGTDAGNYSLASSAINGNVGIITVKSLTASLTGTVQKIYDATATAAISAGNYIVSGVMGGDTVNLNNPSSGTYNDKNVGTGKTVSVSGLNISGTDANNYALTSSSINAAVGIITAKSLTASLTGTVSKTYDATTAATLAGGNYNLAGVIGGDTVALNNPTAGTYDNKNAGTSKTVSVSGLSINGTDASNYSLAASSINGAVGTITAKSLTASLTGTVQKVYDATTAAALAAGNYIVSGVIGGDTVNLNNPTSGTYNNKNVGTGKNVAVSGLAISGTDASNYSLASSSINGNIGQIDVRTMTASLISQVIKTYDGTTTATLDGSNYSLAGFQGADTVTLNNPTSGTYASATAGLSKNVTVSGLALSGTDAGNYALASTTINANNGQIDPKALTASLTGTAQKIYDGTNVAALAPGNYLLSGVVGSDAVSLNNPTAGTYNDKNVGTGKTVTSALLSLVGADAGNYILPGVIINGNIGQINAKALTASLTGSVSKTYNGTTAAALSAGNYNLAGVIGADVVNLNNPTSGAYNDKNVGTAKNVSVSGLALSGAGAGNYTLAATSINDNIGQITAKTLTASLTGTVQKVYDATTAAAIAAGNYLLSGVVGGDTVALNNPTAGTYNNKNVGTGKNINVSGLVISGADASNYNLASGSINANIGQIDVKSIAASLTGTVQKVYDATTAAAIAAGNYVVYGVIGGDTVNLNNPTSGTYDNKNAGTSKTVSVSGLSISGTDAPNYSLAASSVNGNIGQIDVKTIAASLTGSVQKVYDATTAAALAAGNYVVSGVIGADVVTLNNPTTGTYNNKNAGIGKNVAVSGLALSGTDAGNYSLAASSVNANIGQIDAKTLTASLTGTVQKVYDATTTAAIAAGNYVVSGVVGGDTVVLNNPTSGTYNSKNVGTGKNVAVSGLAISGADASNYTLASGSINANIGQITAKALTAFLTGSATKTYDGSTTASLTGGNYTLAGVIGGDTVVLNNPTSGTYNDKNTGVDKIVSVSGLAISGTDAGNYALSSSSAAAGIGQIDAKSLTASLTGSVVKTYDGTTNATLSAGNYNLTGVVGGDSISLNNPVNGAYNDKNAGSGKTITVAGLTLNGGDAGNYSLFSNEVAANIGLINVKALTASLTGTIQKVYDATTAATIAAGNYIVSGAIGGDTVNLNNPTSGTYNNKNVGTSKTVSVTGLALNGADASNYSLAASSINGNIGQIDAKSLTASLTGTAQKIYDGNTAATLVAGNYNLAGVIGGDTVALNNQTSGTYNEKNVGTSKTVSVSGLSLNGGDAGNYTLAANFISGAIGQIDAKTITAALTGIVTKTYDGTDTALLTSGNYTFAGTVGADDVSLVTVSSGTYNDRNVGADKAVNISGLALGGTDAGNYALTTSSLSGNVGQITAKALTAALTGTVTKTYDGTTTAILTSGNYNLSGIIGGDTVALNNPVNGAYADIHAGTGKTVNVSGLSISGADAGNYSLASSSAGGAVGQINARTLTASLIGLAQKTYDGTTAALLNAGNFALSGILGADTVTLNDQTAGVYDSKNVGAGKIVTVNDLSLEGAGAGNYVLASSTLNAAIGQVDVKQITAALTGTVTKTYDGTMVATLSDANYTLNSVVVGDNLILNNPTAGLYDTKDIGTGKIVSVSGLLLSGTDVGNYLLSSIAISGAVGQIDAQPVSAIPNTVTQAIQGTTAMASAQSPTQWSSAPIVATSFPTMPTVPVTSIASLNTMVSYAPGMNMPSVTNTTSVTTPSTPAQPASASVSSAPEAPVSSDTQSQPDPQSGDTSDQAETSNNENTNTSFDSGADASSETDDSQTNGRKKTSRGKKRP